MDKEGKLLEFKRDQIRREMDVTNNEFAAEVFPLTTAPDNKVLRMESNKAIGWVALFTALASLVVWPVILGPAGAIVGVFAYTRGMRTLGMGSVVIGLISLIAYIVLVPFYTYTERGSELTF